MRRKTMTAHDHPVKDGKKAAPVSNKDVDRQVLREEISRRYEHTLRRLGQ